MSESFGYLIFSFPHAVATGLLVAAVCAVFGVFVILKRVVFIGIALSEMAACGVAGALMAGLPPLAGALALTLAAVAVLALPFESRRIPRDAFMGVLFVAASSASVLLVSRSGVGLNEVKSLLYGDLILATRSDLLAITALLVPALAALLLFFRPILYAFLDREAATVLGVKPARWEMLFFLLLGLVVAGASKVAGALLVFCYLVVPASLALLLTRHMQSVLIVSVGVSLVLTFLGIGVSFKADLPTNQTICALMSAIVILTMPFVSRKRG